MAALVYYFSSSVAQGFQSSVPHSNQCPSSGEPGSLPDVTLASEAPFKAPSCNDGMKKGEDVVVQCSAPSTVRPVGYHRSSHQGAPTGCAVSHGPCVSHIRSC